VAAVERAAAEFEREFGVVPRLRVGASGVDWLAISAEWNAEGQRLTEADLARSKAFNGIHTENIPGTDRAVQNRDNDYLIDRALQASGGSFTGMRGLGIQDCAIQESMGPIANRTIEHLGISDTAIVKIRRLLLQALKDFLEANNLKADWQGIENAPNEALVNALAMMSPYGVAEKQALLEAPDLKTRAEMLIAMTEIELAKKNTGGETPLQ